MKQLTTSAAGSTLLSTIATAAIGGILGGSVAALLVIGFTEILKLMLGVVSRQATWVLILMPILGLALSVLVLYGFGLSSGTQSFQRPHWARVWRTFPPRRARADLTGDMVAFAGEEDRFPWRQAPIRMFAMVATVGFGAAMGTEAPAAYLGVATGAALGNRWRPLLRPAAVGGGAAGVAALMGIPLLGTAYILELGRRHHAPLNTERVTAALLGGFVGWLLHIALNVNLLRLVVPREPPHAFHQAVITALLIGLLSGTITAISGAAISRAKSFTVHPIARLTLSALVLGAAAVILAKIASPSAAVGPGGGAITWVEGARASVITVFAVDVLRAVATTASAAAGGCGGLFVPFLAIGDLAGRVFAPSLGLPDDLAGAAGAAGGISGGYHLPFTAVAMVLGQGGNHLAMLTCLATVVVAGFAGRVAATLMGHAYIEKRTIEEQTPTRKTA
ncbi:MAG TPA: chloride channel protein [Candidatus Angelobacter sp.]|nr:chloride channel protein [Candidatus Angelobacter sp.]